MPASGIALLDRSPGQNLLCNVTDIFGVVETASATPFATFVVLRTERQDTYDYSPA